jgi:hypothetical protein
MTPWDSEESQAKSRLEPDIYPDPELRVELALQEPIVFLCHVAAEVDCKLLVLVDVLCDTEAAPLGRGYGVKAPAACQPVLPLRLEELPCLGELGRVALAEQEPRLVRKAEELASRLEYGDEGA